MKNRGFTIPEVLISMVLVSFLTIVMFEILSRGREDFFQLEANTELYANARRGIEEVVRDIRETDESTVALANFTDPIDGGVYQVLAFASARNAAGNFIVDLSSMPDWQSVEVLCHYTDYADNGDIGQLRRYVVYNSSFTFPFKDITVSGSDISMVSENGIPVSISRDGGRVMANYIKDEAYEMSDNNISIAYTMSKNITRLKRGARVLEATLRTGAQMRNR
ncbi:MAG: hypothetical protein AUJ75_02100 [Candidatus Omnitrophica bacterium CG1_02_49_10]|nr:MAG: hypothetical protein AUJ75_02100 [Candidatus Omnitrophica bacterium CG1_02_49_10]